MSQTGFVSVETILSKFHRDLGQEGLNEFDAIEWIGEAAELLSIPSVKEEAVYFAEIRDFETDLPPGFHQMRMVAKHMNWTKEKKCSLPKNVVETEQKKMDKCRFCQSSSCGGSCSSACDFSEYFPFVNTTWQYIDWTQSPFFINNFQEVTPSRNVFFNSLVCEEDDIPYENCGEEYSIVGTVNRKLRVSFRSGYVALAYYKNATDENGYPLIPDEVRFLTAVTHYLGWKIAQRLAWHGRQGYAGLAQENERLWLKYSRQGKNHLKMIESGGKVFKD